MACPSQGAANCAARIKVLHCDEIMDRKYINVRLLAGARDGQVDIVREALLAGANTETRQPMKVFAGHTGVNASRKGGKRCNPTPLMLAAKSGSVPCIKVLLRYGARLDAKDEDLMRPVHFAALSGEFSALQALIAARANPGVLDANQCSVLDHLPAEVHKDHRELRLWREAIEEVASKFPQGIEDCQDEKVCNGVDVEDESSQVRRLIEDMEAASNDMCPDEVGLLDDPELVINEHMMRLEDDVVGRFFRGSTDEPLQGVVAQGYHAHPPRSRGGA